MCRIAFETFAERLVIRCDNEIMIQIRYGTRTWCRAHAHVPSAAEALLIAMSIQLAELDADLEALLALLATRGEQ